MARISTKSQRFSALMSGVEALAFSEAEVLRLTGVSTRKLRHWVDTHVLEPDNIATFGEGGRRLYSFRDLIELRVLAQLRQDHSLQALRRVHSYLKTIRERPWSRLRLFVMKGGGVAFKEPESGKVVMADGPTGQVIEETLIDLQEVSHRLREDVVRSRERGKAQVGQVERKRGLVGGKPVIAGTRIPVSVIQSLHKSGVTIAEIRKRFPRLEPADIRAAIGFKGPARGRASA